MNNLLGVYILQHYLKAGGKGALATTKTNTFSVLAQSDGSTRFLQPSYPPYKYFSLFSLTIKVAHRAWFGELLKTKLVEDTCAAVRTHPG